MEIDKHAQDGPRLSEMKALWEQTVTILITWTPSLPLDQFMDLLTEQRPSNLVHGPNPIGNQAQHRDEARDGKDIHGQTSGIHIQAMFDTICSPFIHFDSHMELCS
jgi:hypothetical protein